MKGVNVEIEYATSTFTLPSGATAKVREMTGREEDLLANEKLLNSGRVPSLIIRNVTLELDGKKLSDEGADNLLSADRVALMIESRKLTYGPVVEGEVNCQHCNNVLALSVNLDELEVRPKPDELEPTVVLPNGANVTLKPLTGKDEQRIAIMRQQQIDLATGALLLRIKSVEGVKPVELKAWLQQLSMRDRQYLRKVAEAQEFGYVTTQKAICPACTREFQFDVLSLPSFFFPGVTS